MSSMPPESEPSGSTARWQRVAAWSALAVPLLAAGAALLARRAEAGGVRRGLVGVHFGLVALGFVLAVVALAMRARRRVPGVMAPAVLGLVLGIAFAATAGRTWLAPARSAAQWQPYVSSEGRFAVLFPGEPVGRAVGPAGGFQAHDVSAALPDGSIFGVTWLHTPGLRGTADNGQILLDAIVARRAGTGQVLSQRALTFDRHPGRELRLRVPTTTGPNLLVSRDYVIGARSYQLLVQLPEADEKRRGAEIDVFFESFRLVTAETKRAIRPPETTQP
jgi:hypothetical protein